MRALAIGLVSAALLTAGCTIGGDDERAAGEAAETAEQSTVTVTTAAPPAAGDLDAGFAAIPDIVDELQPSVVSVVLDGGEGSGVIVDADTVVTNAHVVGDAREVQVVLASGSRLAARVEATDVRTDLALLSVAGEDLPAANFAEELPRVGELALALGNPLGFEKSVTAGIVSGLHRAIPSSGQTPALIDLIQTDAPISPGNSGGALVNVRGEVIGINVAYIPPEARAVSIGFAIPSATVTSVVQQLQQNGRVRHAFLGVRPGDLTPQLSARFGIEAESGVLVVSVTDDSPAGVAGVEEGDVIVALDGSDVRIVEDLLALLRERAPGDEVALTVLRGGQRREIAVRLSDRPDGG